LTDILRLSNSELMTFLRCRRQWYLSTYLQLTPRRLPAPMSALSIGTLVHDALAAYYDPNVDDRQDPLAFIQEVAAVELEQYPAYEESIAAELKLVHIMLEGYLEWLAETGEDEDIQVLGTERMVEVVLVCELGGLGPIHLLSKLDAPIFRERDGAKLAFEHKTCGSVIPPAELKLDTQLLTEHLALFLDAIDKGATKEEAYDQCHGVMYNMLRKVQRTATAKPPFYAREVIPHNVHELRNHWKHMVAVGREVQRARARLDAGEDHHTVCPPTPFKDRCKWDCAFFKVCVMADDGSDLDGALEALYEPRDPLERYANAERL
jgi:hypothetical protein